VTIGLQPLRDLEHRLWWLQESHEAAIRRAGARVQSRGGE
jgi:hypothetical protein